MKITQLSPKLNTTQNSNRDFKGQQYVNFTATPVKSKLFTPIAVPISKQYDKFTEKIAEGFGKLLDTNFAENIIKNTKNSPHFNKYLVSHLSATGSVILSSLYVKKTLNNPNLDEQKRRTLAINQTAVWGVSTIMCYTFDGMANKQVDNFITKFEKANLGDTKMAHYKNGIKVAKTIMIFDLVYRFIAPVLVTPIANHIGNKIQEKKEAELAVRTANA